ncbi:hypothetical protein BAE44_0001820 [Dichanthelium oligosanthes]|uniref:Eukaryotic translation initiation factor-related n=1 Tax=Dichanthelium oligosanthes TaxID=888268 RepID=A0A1E5WJ40_9POAL|nr:hypothetical protein BAE44_0001820 [Dichanthelium oligosanthes]
MSSKKKAVTTMTLKDFHGGSIPSELPLPSAPGVTPRPADRPVSSGSPVAVAVARPRVPVASPTAAMPSFLTTPSRIGRHFDEDERTPFEPAAPRRPAPSPTSYAPSPVVVPARSGPGNAWGPKREAAPVASPVSPAPASAGGQIWSATRIAQASAVEKVISGRWHPSKPSSPPAPASAPAVETSVALPEMERPSSVGVREVNGGVERGAAPARPASHEGRIGEGRVAEAPEERVAEAPERPKLKLLPRSKPVEAPESSPTYVEDKQVHQVQVTTNVMKVEVVHDVHQNATAAKTGVLGADTEIRVAERPRLNLKPRSNVTGQSDETGVKERYVKVLRERGVDVLASDLEKTSPVGRSKSEFAKVEQKVEAISINPSAERVEGFPAGHRGPRNGDRKDYKRDTDRADAYRPTRREDNRRVARDVEKLPEQPRPEPETWRKPVEPPKPEVTTPRFGKAATALELAQAFSTSMSDTVPQSRLTSVPSPRVPPSPGARDQSGFSRLTDNRALHSSPSQRKINGY